VATISAACHPQSATVPKEERLSFHGLRVRLQAIEAEAQDLSVIVVVEAVALMPVMASREVEVQLEVEWKEGEVAVRTEGPVAELPKLIATCHMGGLQSPMVCLLVPRISIQTLSLMTTSLQWLSSNKGQCHLLGHSTPYQPDPTFQSSSTVPQSLIANHQCLLVV